MGESLVTTMTPVITQITATERDLVDTVTLTLEHPPTLPMPEPGQFAMLWVPGVGEVPISYSAIGPGRQVEHTIRSVGATTAALVALGPGDTIGVRGPFGRGWQLDELVDADVLIVAGGLGLAPLRPVVDRFADGHADRADDLGARSVRLLVGARSPDLVLHADRIDGRWRSLHPVVTVDHPTPDWRGPVGHLSVGLAGALDEPERVAALLCGPEIMMLVLGRQLEQAGVPAERIQVSLERNMQCGVGHCGHCQLGPLFTCTEGPVVGWREAAPYMAVRER